MAHPHPAPLRIIDSHTAGEPTRIIVDGLPFSTQGGPTQARETLRAEYDWLRTALVTEPRGAPWMVGAALLPPTQPGAVAGVVFFNNAGYLGMCGHGLIGLVATLAYLGRLTPGRHLFETPVGDVVARLEPSGEASLENVPSYRLHRDAQVVLADGRTFVGDVAWGGNWFFLTKSDAPLEWARVAELTHLTQAIRDALPAAGVCGADGAEIDHIELVGPPSEPGRADARNFVLCPGGEYDRSPCGTGTSAKVACLAADGKLAPGQTWRQESITGGVFTASYRPDGDRIVPTISGRAFVNGDWTLVIDPADPLKFGVATGAHGALI
jgi:4-hydroxyproline epimerase